MKKKIQVSDVIIYILLILGACIAIIPFLWMISSSLKYGKDIFEFPIKWIPENPQWVNYKRIFEKAPLHLYYFNTIKITVITVALMISTSALAAYAFAKLKFPGRDKIFLGYIGTLMIPFQVIMIPQFLMIRKLGLGDTHMALILVTAFTPYGVFLLRQFFITIPEEISESARIDGASEFVIFSKLILPLTKPAIASLGIWGFVHTWNQFLEPLIYLKTDAKKTIQLGVRVFQTQYGNEYELIMAAAVISVLPMIIVYLFSQKFFIKGIAFTGTKG